MSNNISDMVKNLLKAVVGILFAILLVMMIATFLMDNQCL